MVFSIFHQRTSVFKLYNRGIVFFFNVLFLSSLLTCSPLYLSLSLSLSFSLEPARRRFLGLPRKQSGFRRGRDTPKNNDNYGCNRATTFPTLLSFRPFWRPSPLYLASRIFARDPCQKRFFTFFRRIFLRYMRWKLSEIHVSFGKPSPPRRLEELYSIVKI